MGTMGAVSVLSWLREAYREAYLPATPAAVQAGDARAVATSAGLGAYTWDPLLGHTSRAVAMSLPTVARSRDVLCGSLAQVPLRAWLWDRVTFTATEHPAPPTWLERPDPNRTRAALIADLLDDLIFHAVGYLEVTARDAAQYPSAFRYVPADEVTREPGGGLWLWGSHRIAARNMIVIESTQTASLAHGYRAIDTATKLEEAANRFAATEVPAGWLQQTGGIPLTPKEQEATAERFAAARLANTVAMLSEHITWNESSYDPARLQLTEARSHQATELARVMNVPASVVYAPQNDSMTYSNGQDARRDLWWFGLAPHAEAIQATLSGPNVTPRGTIVRFDPIDLLTDPFEADASAEPAPPTDAPEDTAP